MDTFTIIVVGTGVTFCLLTFCAIFDIARKDFGSTKTKALWGFITLIPFFGPILYYSLGYRKGKNPESSLMKPNNS